MPVGSFGTPPNIGKYDKANLTIAKKFACVQTLGDTVEQITVSEDLPLS